MLPHRRLALIVTVRVELIRLVWGCTVKFETTVRDRFALTRLQAVQHLMRFQAAIPAMVRLRYTFPNSESRASGYSQYGPGIITECYCV